MIIITVDLCSTFLQETSNALSVIVGGKEEALKMAFEGLQSKINVLTTVILRLRG